MFFDIIGTIGSLSIACVQYKFPKEFYELKYRQTVFDLADMISDELSNKNMEIFTNAWIDKIVPAKDIIC